MSQQSGVYHQFKNLTKAPIKMRIGVFRETAIELLGKGWSVEEMRETIQYLKDREMYEGMQGVIEALKAFKENPQAILKLKKS